MWLCDHKCNMELSARFGTYYARLPLEEAAVIHCGNALAMDWQVVSDTNHLDYVLGNPPFLGYSNRNENQKKDILSVYVDLEGKTFKKLYSTPVFNTVQHCLDERFFASHIYMDKSNKG